MSGKAKSWTSYSRLPTEDHSVPAPSAAFDFSSAFDFSQGTRQYKSIYSFTPSSTSLDISYSRYERKAQDIGSKIVFVFFVAMGYILFIAALPWSLCCFLKRVSQHERLVVFRLGRLYTINSVGLVIIIPWVDRCVKVDLRTKAFHVPPQQILLADGAIVEVGAEVLFHIADVVRSLTFVRDLNLSTRQLSQTVLGNLLKSKTLDDIQHKSSHINQEVQDALNQTTKEWGLEISRMEITPPKILIVSEQGQAAGETFLSCLQAFQKSNIVHGGSDKLQKAVVPSPVVAEEVTLMERTNSSQSMVDILLGKMQHILEDKQTGINGVFLFEIVEKNEEDRIIIYDASLGKLSICNGHKPHSDVTIRASAEEFLALISGEMNPLQAYMSGRLEVSGNKGLMSELSQILR